MRRWEAMPMCFLIWVQRYSLFNKSPRKSGAFFIFTPFLQQNAPNLPPPLAFFLQQKAPRQSYFFKK